VACRGLFTRGQNRLLYEFTDVGEFMHASIWHLPVFIVYSVGGGFVHKVPDLGYNGNCGAIVNFNRIDFSGKAS